MNKKIWWVIGILLVVATTLIILKKKEVIGKKEATKVATEKIIKRTIIESVSASGKVYPEDERKVSSDVSGEVVGHRHTREAPRPPLLLGSHRDERQVTAP